MPNTPQTTNPDLNEQASDFEEIETALRDWFIRRRNKQVQQLETQLLSEGFPKDKAKNISEALDDVLNGGTDSMPADQVESEAQRWCELWSDWDDAEENAAFRLAECRSVQEVLDWLLRMGRQYQIQSLRCYRLHTERARKRNVLVAVGCAGENNETAQRLLSGVRKEQAVTHESFLCLEEKRCRPIVFRVEKGREGYEQDGLIGDQIEFYRAEDTCADHVNLEPPRLYVDIPLKVEGTPTLKLSCDFIVTDEKLLDENDIFEFWKLAQMAADALLRFYEKEMNARLESICGELIELDKPADIWKRVCDWLPKEFNCDGVLLYEIRKDFAPIEGDSANDVLALVADSRHAGVGGKRPHYYELGAGTKDYIIPTVARTGASYRFDNVSNQHLRREQGGKAIDWSDSNHDWQTIGSMMLIPVFSEANDKEELLGVLVLFRNVSTEHSDVPWFTSYDECLANRMVRECLTPRMRAVKRVAERHSNEKLFFVKDASELVDKPDEWPQIIVRVLQRMIPEENSRKFYGICKIEDNVSKLSVAFADGRLDNKQSGRRRISARGKIALLAMEEPSGDVVYRNVLSGERNWTTPGAVCEMACVIPGVHGPIGAIVVKSDRYDLSIDEHGQILKVLASSASEILRGNASGDVFTE